MNIFTSPKSPQKAPKKPYFLASRFFGFFQKKSRFFTSRFKFFGIFQIKVDFIFSRFKFFDFDFYDKAFFQYAKYKK